MERVAGRAGDERLVLAALALAEYEKADSQAAAKRNVREAIEQVSARLGNTVEVKREDWSFGEGVAQFVDGALA